MTDVEEMKYQSLYLLEYKQPMTILQISIPDKKEKAVRILLKELGVSIKKVEPKNGLLSKVKNAVDELNAVKTGKAEAKDFDNLLDEL